MQLEWKELRNDLRLRYHVYLAALLCTGFAGARSALGQALPTATQSSQLSAFGGITGVYTGLPGAYGGTVDGRNASITAGVTFGVQSFHSFYPSIEVRGTYPIASGKVAGEKNILGGLVVAKHFGRLQPYGDFFFGRGALTFVTPYFNQQDTSVFVQTVSAVWAPGAGANFFLTRHIGIKADFQLEHYATPVVSSGSIYSKAGTLGVIYRIGGGFKHSRR
jgi:hypothetical protein